MTYETYCNLRQALKKRQHCSRITGDAALASEVAASLIKLDDQWYAENPPTTSNETHPKTQPQG